MFAYVLASKPCSEATNMIYLSSNGLTLAGFGESNQRKEDLKRKWRETDGFRLFSPPKKITRAFFKHALVTLIIQRVLNLLPHFQSQRYQSYPLIPSQHLGIRTQGVSVRGGYFFLQGREGQVKR